MTSPNTIIERLREEFGCRLSSRNIINLLNVVEKRLAADVLRRVKVTTVNVKKGERVVALDGCIFVRNVKYNGRQIFAKSSANPTGYTFSNGKITLGSEVGGGELLVEYIAFPDEITLENYDKISLSAGEGHDEIYLYHVLSREALMDNDIERLNNYSLLYTHALNSLRTEVFNGTNAAFKFSNLW